MSRLENRKVMREHTGERRDEALERVKWLLELEAYAFTLSQHHLQDYQGKFLVYYQTQRQIYFNRRGHEPPEPAWSFNQDGLEIMATVRAYFQGIIVLSLLSRMSLI